MGDESAGRADADTESIIARDSGTSGCNSSYLANAYLDLGFRSYFQTKNGIISPLEPKKWTVIGALSPLRRTRFRMCKTFRQNQPPSGANCLPSSWFSPASGR